MGKAMNARDRADPEFARQCQIDRLSTEFIDAACELRDALSAALAEDCLNYFETWRRAIPLARRMLSAESRLQALGDGYEHFGRATEKDAQ